MKQTPLYEKHVEAGGKIVPFAGYALPVNYPAGIIAEHNNVRNQAGLFDVSHMGEITLSGKDALQNVNYLLTNDYDHMEIGQIRYSPMCNDNGGVVDDLLVYKMAEDRFLLVVNAANHDKDADWIKEHLKGDVQFTDESEDTAQLALQGPQSEAILKSLTEDRYIPRKYYTFVNKALVAGIECLLSRTGYTGEDGFEIYCKPQDAPILWDTILQTGKPFGILPAGLGCRDTLRLEAGMPLYGHELNDEMMPTECGLSFFVKMDKIDFIGKKAMQQREKQYKRIGLHIIDRGIAREGAKVLYQGEEIGFVTSGTQSPTLQYPIAMAMVKGPKLEVGTLVVVEVRGKKLGAEVVKIPFYKREK